MGAPLEPVALSLSDNLKPWDLILRRLAAAANAGFVIAIYNPISRARDWRLAAAFEELQRRLPASTPRVVLGRAVGRADEKVAITTLAAANPDAAAWQLSSSSAYRKPGFIARPGRSPLVYTPRAVESVRV